LYIRSSWACAYCAKDLKDAAPREMGLDHLEDLVNGGGHKGANHAVTNLVTCCRRCNSSRQATPWRTFAAQFPGAVERIEAQRLAPVNMELARAIINGTTDWSD